MTPANNAREISQTVRFLILNHLLEKADSSGQLTIDTLGLSDAQKTYFEGAVEWLSSEGLIRTGNKQATKIPQYASASLTAKGERFLDSQQKSLGGSVGAFLRTEARRFFGMSRDAFYSEILSNLMDAYNAFENPLH
jgi:hypothetical protein